MSVRQRFFAWRLRRFGHLADTALARKKQDVFAGASGDILEIGAGTGLNRSYLTNFSQLLALEPNELLHASLFGSYSKILRGTAEAIALPDSSVDTVISSLVLCSVSRLDKALDEIRRILRPGGTFRFVEHVPAPVGTCRCNCQRLLSPLSRYLGDGCAPDRDIERFIRSSALVVVRLDHFIANVHDPLIRDFIAGILKKPNHSLRVV